MFKYLIKNSKVAVFAFFDVFFVLPVGMISFGKPKLLKIALCRFQ